MTSASTTNNAQGRTRFIAILLATTLLIVGSIGYVVFSRMHPASAPDFESSGDGTVKLVEIAPGSSLIELGPELVSRGIVKSDQAFQAAAMSNPSASKVTPGFYKLEGQMKASAAVQRLLDPAAKVELLQVPGGATLFDVAVVGGKVRPGIYSQIAKVACAAAPDSNCVTVAKLQQAAISTDPAQLGVPDWAVEHVAARGDDPRRLEGLIAPGDYVIDPKMDARGILTKLLSESAKTWNETGIVEKSRTAGMTPYELLTAASLVEREAPAGEFGKVARVIANRLAEPMRLEFDSTVNYDLPSQEVATTDADRARVTAWNTYAMDGLPATPIASPSVQAVEAMENPTPGDWLFFVTTDKDGTTEFSRTFDEHMAKTQKSVDNGVLDSQR